MAEEKKGTGVGSIFLDLIVRNTVGKQVENIATQAQATAKEAFSGMEKAAETSANKAAAATSKITQTVASSAKKCSQGIESSLGGSFNKSVELSKARVKELETQFARVTASLNEAKNADNDTAVQKLLDQQIKLYDRLAAARERLAIRARAAAEKQAATEVAAAHKTAEAAEAAASRQRAAVATAHTSADPPQTGGVSGQVSLWERLIGLAGNFGNVAAEAFSKANGSAVSFGNIASEAFSKAGGFVGLFGGKVGTAITIVKTAANTVTGVFSKIVSKIKGTFTKIKTVVSKVSTAVNKLTGRFNTAGKATSRFGSRLREIVSGALIFNGISAALRNVISYFSEAITSTDEMKEALANLKGAAANAASPLIQVLTPALTALTNAAATALSYVSRLVTMLTGKVSNAAVTAAKSAEKAAGAAKKASKSLASFDQIERLGGNSDSDSSDAESDSVEPNYDFQGHSPFLESILSAIKAGQWGQIGALIAEKLNSSLAAVPWEDIQSKVKNWTQNMVDTLNGLATNVDWGLIGSTIGNGLNTLLIIINTFFRGIDWVTLGRGIATGLNDLFTTIDWELLGKVLTDKLRALFGLFHGFVENFDFAALGTRLAQMLEAALNNIDWVQLAGDICKGLIGLFDMAVAFVQELDWDVVRQTISDCFDSINWGALGQKIGELLRSIEWGEIIGSVWELISELWKAKWETLGSILWEVVKDVGKSLFEDFKEAGINGILGLMKGLSDPMKTIREWLSSKITGPLIDKICDLLGIHSPSTVFAEIGQNLIEGLLNGISETWGSITEFFENVFADLKDSFSQTWNDISAGVSEATQDIYREISAAFTNVKDRVTTIWNNISSTIKGVVNGIIGSINGMISGITSGINSVIRALNKLSFTIPDWLKHVPGASNIAGKKFGFNIQTITAPQIPYLADGGVIQQPTLAMMGEYAGARSNPEIVAPQSLMAETVAGVMEDVLSQNAMGLEEAVAILRDILQAILGIKIGDEVIGKAAARYNRRMSRAGGY